MAENLVKWRSKREPISKFGLSNGGKGVTTPLAPERWCDSHEVGCHPGNVGLGFGLLGSRGLHQRAAP